MERGLDAKRLFDVDFPPYFDSSLSVRCSSRTHSAMGRVILAAYKDVHSCAKDSGEPPWSCAISPAAGRLAKTLPRLVAPAGECADAIGLQDSPIARMCNRAIATTDVAHATLYPTAAPLPKPSAN